MDSVDQTTAARAAPDPESGNSWDRRDRDTHREPHTAVLGSRALNQGLKLVALEL
jgi:hypothetical protein